MQKFLKNATLSEKQYKEYFDNYEKMKIKIMSVHTPWEV
jgi:hypothetical protein